MNQKQRTYLDYNATAPLSPPVLSLIQKEELPWGNPSSVHARGKASKREVQKVCDFLFQTFGLSEPEHQLIFHSGATEGINSIIKGMALKARDLSQKLIFFHLPTDHSCVANQKAFLELLNHEMVALPVNSKGELVKEEAEKLLSTYCEGKNTLSLLNWTWVNNETGVVAPLEQASELKNFAKDKGFDLWVHVDGVQAVGKVKEWNQLSPLMDFYTFSGHKFGALKGAGFSFLREGAPLMALLNGGGQQMGFRSGTENTFGILSLKPALEGILKYYDFEAQVEGKCFFEAHIKESLGEKGEVVGESASHRNGNTIYFIINDVKAQASAMAFDMAGFDLSNGSACSSGAVVPSRVLMAMGYNEDQAKSALRVSFDPLFNLEKAKELWPSFQKVLERFL